MKRVLLAFLVFGMGHAGACAESFAVPKLVFPHREVDLDTVTQGEKRLVKFPFSNQGNAGLVVERTRSSCGCTSVFSTSKRVPPDSGGDVSVTFNSQQFRGHKTKRIYIYSNDPVRPVDTLTLKVFVRSELDCTPRNIFFPKAVRGELVSREVTFFNPGDSTIILQSLQADADYIKIPLAGEQALLPGDTFRTTVWVLPPPDTSKTFSASIAVGVNREPAVPFWIRVRGLFAD